MKRITAWLLGSTLITGAAGATAWPVGYGEVTLGGTLLTLNQPDEEMEDRNKAMTTETMRAAGGIEWLPGLSTGFSMWLWGDKVVNTESAEQQMDGISTGVDVRLRLPLGNGSGPYVSYGRQCWQVVITGLENRWSENSCSVVKSAGIAFGTGQRSQYPGAAMVLEYSRMDFNEVEAGSLMVGLRMNF